MSNKRNKAIEIKRDEIQLAMQRFLEKGGKIEKINMVQTGFGFDRFDDLLLGNDIGSDSGLEFPIDGYSFIPPALEN